MSFTITPLGRASGMPKIGNAGSGYLVAGAETKVLIDAGSGVALELSRHVDPEELDAIVITHMHLDHVYDLLSIAKMILGKRLRRNAETHAIEYSGGRPVPIFVPRGGAEQLKAHAALFPVISSPVLDQAFETATELIEYDPGFSTTVGEFTVDLIGLLHVVTNCGIRISDGQSILAFTGDTGRTTALLDLARDADLFISESTFDEPDTSGHGHMSPQESGEVAREANVGTLMLTHFLSMAETHLAAHEERASAAFGQPVRAVVPGQPITISPRS